MIKGSNSFTRPQLRKVIAVKMRKGVRGLFGALGIRFQKAKLFRVVSRLRIAASSNLEHGVLDWLALRTFDRWFCLSGLKRYVGGDEVQHHALQNASLYARRFSEFIEAIGPEISPSAGGN